MKKEIFQVTVLLAFISTVFFSCQKSMDDPVRKMDDPFPENDASLVVMPGGAGSSSSVIGRNDEKYNTFYGPQVQIGNGHMRSWINITHSGKPVAIGIEMTAGALNNLPQDAADHMAATWHVKLHQKAHGITPFDHIMMNWNVNGHEPPQIYGLPHFDFHFYKVSMEEVMNTTDPAKFAILPPADYIPPMYFNPGGGVPMMGAHWIDLLAPEMQAPGSANWAAFTHTFIYGSYNGEVTFVEPMITLAFLNSGVTVQKPYRQPLMFSPTGTNYPTRYNIWKDGKTNRHYVALDEMIMR
ncbi:MAG: hypothetical protein GXC73_13445 [Chitinophagaceae bacterium]|nr:hypothetical protein [Chitinophagaceae bacterium]